MYYSEYAHILDERRLGLVGEIRKEGDLANREKRPPRCAAVPCTDGAHSLIACWIGALGLEGCVVLAHSVEPSSPAVLVPSLEIYANPARHDRWPALEKERTDVMRGDAALELKVLRDAGY